MTSLMQFQWGENLELMYNRILRYPDRVRNLYFTFLFVLRAVTKVSNTACYSYFRISYIHMYRSNFQKSFTSFVNFCRHQITWSRLSMILATMLRMLKHSP